MDRDTAMLLTQSKSMAVGMIMTWFFGGLGVFYVSLVGGLIMGGLEFVSWIITFMTVGFGIILLIPVHIVALVWTYMGVKKHNNRLIANLSDSAETVTTV